MPRASKTTTKKETKGYKPSQLTYRRLVSSDHPFRSDIENFGNETVELVVDIQEGQKVVDVFDATKKTVELLLGIHDADESEEE